MMTYALLHRKSSIWMVSNRLLIFWLSHRLSSINWIKKKLFPESAIHSQCTTRRSVSKVDNTASLQQFFLDYDQELATRFDMFEQVESNEELQEDFQSVLLMELPVVENVDID